MPDSTQSDLEWDDEPVAERFDAPGCQMCGAPEGDPCDCVDPQEDHDA